jgi:hypothetical protein
MGIIQKFKDFRGQQQEKSAQKSGDLLKNKVTTKEQRMEAIESLASMPAKVALPQLMKRFEMVVDHGIQDNREKEMVEEVFLKHTEDARVLVREAVLTAARVSWPIRLAEKLFQQGEFKALLLQGLNTDAELFNETMLERNVELLLALRDFPDEVVVEKASTLLKGRDEGVRMAALECLEFQARTSEKAKSVVLALLSEPSTDANSRLLGVVKGIVQRYGWTPANA